jgi:homoserine O-acetyltransferase/O-succinyltransferase
VRILASRATAARWRIGTLLAAVFAVRNARSPPSRDAGHCHCHRAVARSLHATENGGAMPAPTDHELFDLGDLALQNGGTLRAAKLAYKTYGTLNDDKSNVILHPTWFSAWHDANEWTIEPGLACDPGRYFIVVPNQINNGLSSSPSNTPPPFDGPHFPPVTFYDQVEAQHRLLTQKWGIESLELVLGSSMGAGQTYQWAVSHPEMVKRAAPIVGSPRTSEHNQVFLKSLRATLTLDPAFRGGRYSPDAPPVDGLRAFARIYAGWGLSQAFYGQREYRQMDFSSLEDFLVGFWEGFWLDGRDPNDLLAMLWTWEQGDVGRTPGFDGDTEAALRSIRCPLVSMPARTDLYFPPEDEQHWSQFIPDGEVRVIDTIYGHFAGLGMHEPDNQFIDKALRELLSRSV